MCNEIYIYIYSFWGTGSLSHPACIYISTILSICQNTYNFYNISKSGKHILVERFGLYDTKLVSNIWRLLLLFRKKMCCKPLKIQIKNYTNVVRDVCTQLNLRSASFLTEGSISDTRILSELYKIWGWVNEYVWINEWSRGSLNSLFI